MWGLSVIGHVLAAIRRGGYVWNDLRGTRRGSFWMDVEEGARPGLLFAALKPRREYRRIAEVAGAILATGTRGGVLLVQPSPASDGGEKAPDSAGATDHGVG